jgi:hypothetical protein
MTTGIVIMNSHPLQTFEQYCRKNRLKYVYAYREIAEDELGNDYILVSNYRNTAGRQFDRIIIISNELYDLTARLKMDKLCKVIEQDILLIKSERYVE